MKLSGYIIEKYDSMRGSYTCHRLVEEAKALDIHIDIIGANDCIVTEQGIINRGRILEQRDFVINRYKWGKTKQALNMLARKSYNDISIFNCYVNKFEQMTRLQSSYFLKPLYCLSTTSLQYEELTARLGTPFIAKGLENSMGREIELIDSISDYLSLKKNYAAEKEWLFEEYIATSYGRDLRLYSIRGEAIACIMRQSNDGFRANMALGATATQVNIDTRLKEIAKDIYQQTKLDFVGIDLLFGEREYYLCEINVMPGLEGVETATGTNIAREMLLMIKKDFENE